MMEQMPGIGGSDVIENLPYYEYIHHRNKLIALLEAKEKQRKSDENQQGASSNKFNIRNMMPKISLPKLR